MTAILALFARLPAWVWIAAALLAGGLFYGHLRYNAGQADIQEKWDAESARVAAEIKSLHEKQAKVTTITETKFIERERVIHEKGETIIKRVPVYLPADTPDLPGAFRVLHDAASQGFIPDAASFAHAAPVAAVAATETVAGNYTTCLANAEQLTLLQDWIRQQQELNP